MMNDSDKVQTQYITQEDLHNSRPVNGYGVTSLDDIFDMGWQACAAKSAEKIARLTKQFAEVEKQKKAALRLVTKGLIAKEELKKKLAALEEEVAELSRNYEKRYYEGHAAGRQENINERLHGEKVAAAAQADNARLREASRAIIESGGQGETCGCKFCQQAREMIAQPLDTSTLDAYVAKKAIDGASLLRYVIEFARKDGGHSWIPMAAFDNETAALSYKKECDRRDSPWTYHMVTAETVNLPAIIEQAKTEECERCVKLIEAQDVDPAFKHRIINSLMRKD